MYDAWLGGGGRGGRGGGGLFLSLYFSSLYIYRKVHEEEEEVDRWGGGERLERDAREGVCHI